MMNNINLKIMAGCSLYLLASAAAANLELSDRPLGIGALANPMVMITLARDHTLYYESYNDATDLDGNGTVDEYETRFNPSNIYYGMFSSEHCYTYSSNNFVIDSKASGDELTCGGGLWSGNFLNYATTSRMDALRQVLYGGKRISDTQTETIIEAAYVPRDAHSWGKMYDPNHGYNISDYTPLADNQRHILARTAVGFDGTNVSQRKPLLRIWTNVPRSTADNANSPEGGFRPWHWVGRGRGDSSARQVARTSAVTDSGKEVNISGATFLERSISAKVCASTEADKRESYCTTYKVNETVNAYKPTGILQNVGAPTDGGSIIEFGLMTGSYFKNLKGGVLRHNIKDLRTEINPNTGVITATNGLFNTLNTFRISRFGEGGGGGQANTEYGNCGLLTSNALTSNDGQCQDWGNPLAGMMYEVLRYFAGKKAPSSSFAIANKTVEDVKPSDMNLPLATWEDPYATRKWCTPAYNLVISGAPSYDSTELPGSPFTTLEGGSATASEVATNDIAFNVSNVMAGIDTLEAVSGKKFVVGESLDDASNTANTPTAKSVTSLARIRGLSPDEPTKGGSYHSAALAYFGNTTDLRPELQNRPNTIGQNVKTIAVSLASPLPKFTVDSNNDGVGDVTIVPFGKSVKNNGIDGSQGKFQPTLTITDYYIEKMTATSGKIRVNFEDVEQGYDHEMDAIVIYEYELITDVNTHSGKIKHAYHPTASYNSPGVTKLPVVKVSVRPILVAAAMEMHAGYVISGTHADGTYLEVSQSGDTASGNVKATEYAYYLDTFPEKTGEIQDLPHPNNFRNKDAAYKDSLIPDGAPEGGDTCAVPTEPQLSIYLRIGDQDWGFAEPLRLWAWSVQNEASNLGGGDYFSGGWSNRPTIVFNNAGQNGGQDIGNGYFKYTFTKAPTLSSGGSEKPYSANFNLSNNSDTSVNLRVPSTRPRCFILKDKASWAANYQGVYGSNCTNAPASYFSDYKNWENWNAFQAAPYNGDALLWTTREECQIPDGQVKYFHPEPNNVADALENPLWFVGKYGWFNATPNNLEPDIDTEWQLNGKPIGYLPAFDGNSMQSGLTTGIGRVNNDAQKRSSTIGLSGGNVSKDTLLYQASADPADWSGDLVAVDLSGYEQGEKLEDQPKVWFAKAKMAAIPHGNRAVYAYRAAPAPADAEGFLFKFDSSKGYFEPSYDPASGFSNAQLDALIAGTSGTAAVKQAELERRLAYWRGDASNEGTLYRSRTHQYEDGSTERRVLGDILDSRPLLTGDNLGLSKELLSIGANDGMLHVFDGSADASAGNVLFSFVPTPVMAKMPQLLQPMYKHKYFVNGQQVARRLGDNGDVMLVGTLGAGGQGVYALNMSEAAKLSNFNTSAAAKSVVAWEYTSENDADLGYTFGKANIAKLRDGTWAAIFANGYNSVNNKAMLFVVNAETGALIRKIDTGFTVANGQANGLSEALVTDSNRDGYADFVYAGDLQGNLWGFDISSSDKTKWAVMHKNGANPAPLFRAVNTNDDGVITAVQPITAAPAAARHPNGGVMLIVGTGKFLEDKDASVPDAPDSDQPINAVYALWDKYAMDWGDGESPAEPDTTPITVSDLVEQEITLEANDRRVTSQYPVEYPAKRGWFLKLLKGGSVFEGERMVNNINLDFNKATFTTLIPSLDPCLGGGFGWVMQMDILYGKSWVTPVLADPEDTPTAEQLEKLTNQRVDGTPGAPTDLLISADGKAVTLIPTTSPSPDKSVVVLDSQNDVAGRQSWLQLFMR